MFTTTSKQKKVGLIGFGYWGQKVYNTISNISDTYKIIISDPLVKNSCEIAEILKDKDIDDVFIVTPEETHFKIAKECLENNKNIFVEKPLCLKKNEALILTKLAHEKDRRLYVDYIFLFDPYVKKIKELIENFQIGELKNIYSVRHSTGVKKPNISVFEDLAIHDIYLGKFFTNEKCQKVETLAEIKINSQIHQASANFYYENIILNAHYSWAQPISKRIMTFIGTAGSIVWDKENSEIFIYKNQELVSKIAVEQNQSPLEKSIISFFDTKKIFNYVEDVEILENIKNK